MARVIEYKDRKIYQRLKDREELESIRGEESGEREEVKEGEAQSQLGSLREKDKEHI